MLPHRVRRAGWAGLARRHGDATFRRRPVVYAGVVCVVLLGGTSSGTAFVEAGASGSGPEVLVSSSEASAAAPTAGSAVTTKTPETAETAETAEAPMESVAADAPTPAVGRDALLAGSMEDVAVEDTAKVSVAALDLGSGESVAYGDGAFDTASIVKVDILAALLLRAQDAGRELTTREKTYAAAMIEHSDNASATALWTAIGEVDGLRAANERFGLRDTEGGGGGLWGLTQTTAPDQLTLLRQVFGEPSALGEDSRAYLRGLMEGVVVGQDWGVSAVDGSEFALKNGWLPRSATGLWDVNSVGWVSVGGREFLVAVLPDGNSTKDKGISVVEAAARAAVASFGGRETAVVVGGLGWSRGSPRP